MCPGAGSPPGGQKERAAGGDAEFIIKVGPAFGVILVIATQRPDKTSLPTGVSGNVSTRFCLKVTGQLSAWSAGPVQAAMAAFAMPSPSGSGAWLWLLAAVLGFIVDAKPWTL
jgi:hypothetical protein